MPNTANLTDGPFSSVINYDDERKRLEQEKAQQQEAQKKIMRVNALGDAFRLLIDGVGGMNNATITPKPANPGLFKAVDSYMGLDKEYRDRIDKMRLMDLGAKEKNVQYNLGLQARDQAKQDKIDEEIRQELRDNKKSADALGNAIVLEQERQKGDMAQIDARKKADKELIEIRKKETESSSGKDNSIPVFDDVTGKTIDVPVEIVDKMIEKLQSGKERYDPQLDKVVKAIYNGENVPPIALRNVLRRHWAELRELVPGIQAAPATTPAAEEVPQIGDVQLFQTRVYNTLNNTSLTGRKRKKLLIGALMQQYPEMTEDEAEVYADDLISKTTSK